MSHQSILEEILQISVWKRGGQRAPHKPLLILYALGALSRGQVRLGFLEAEKPLRDLLIEFGPRRASYHPEYPFWRLRKDGIWLLDGADECENRASNNDAKISELRKYDVHGFLRPDIVQAVKSDPLFLADVVLALLEPNFPQTLYSDIVARCGIGLQYFKQTKKRDPEFRDKVLRAYEYRCAVCGLQVQMDGRHLALEAAHIKWHAAGGADDESNGIAMCTLHHKLFDRGAFTIDNKRFVLSENAYGNDGFESSLLQYHGLSIKEPIAAYYSPLEKNLQWHMREVFKGPSRPV